MNDRGNQFKAHINARAMLVCAILFITAGCETTDQLFPKSIGGIPSNYQLQYAQDFQSRQALDDFTFADRDAWRWLQLQEIGVLNQFTQSRYAPPHRSPVNLALLADFTFSDFVMELEIKQTSREYAHRDACVVFGFEDSANFYYVHLSSRADDHAHSVFMVNESPRVSIATERGEGIAWGDGWHKVRIERVSSNGAIFVFFDDMTTPIMWAKDENFQRGRVGFGTFDDSMMIRNFRVHAPMKDIVNRDGNPFESQ